MGLLAAMAAEAAVVVKARSALVQTRMQTHVIGHYGGDLPVDTIALDPRALMLNPEVIEATSAALSLRLPPATFARAISPAGSPDSFSVGSTAPAFGGGTSTETFAAISPAAEASPAARVDAPVPQTRLASLEWPVLRMPPPPAASLEQDRAAAAAALAAMLPPSPPVPAEAPHELAARASEATPDMVLAMLSPPPLADHAPPAELSSPPTSLDPAEPTQGLDAGTPDQMLALLAPQPLPRSRPPAATRPAPVTPLLEPFMEVFEDWVTRAPMNRHPGFYKVHFAPNVQGRCLPKTLINVLYDVGMKFGDVKVISGYRSPSHNRAVGGASRSLHMECRAIDFFVKGSGSGVVDWLIRQKTVGGYKRYPFGSFHIDNGPRRTWAWGKRKKRRR